MQLFPEQGTLGFILNFAVDHQLEFSNFRIKPLLINMVYPLVGNNKQKSHQTERTQCGKPVINQSIFPDQKTANQQTQAGNSNQVDKKTYIKRRYFGVNPALACRGKKMFNPSSLPDIACVFAHLARAEGKTEQIQGKKKKKN